MPYQLGPLKFPDTLSSPADTHNNTVLGVSYGDGRLHLSYDHHTQPLRYRYSRADFLTDPPEEMTLEDFSPRSPLLPDAPDLEQRVTYPRFINDPDGTLYFVYRDGSSGDGDVLIHRYNDATGSWIRLGILLGRTGTYPEWNNSTSRNAYLHDLVFDDEGRLHATWTWRETPAWPSNHGINYAYSDDGGITWHNNEGAFVANLSVGDAILLADDTEVVEAPVNSWLINQGAMTLDGEGQPHILTYRSPEIIEPTQSNPPPFGLHYIHYWRTPDGRWHERYVDDLTVPWTFYEIDPNSARQPLRRGDLLFDDEGNLHAYFAVAGKLYAGVARQATSWADWRIYTIGDQAMARRPAEHGPKYDRVRWERDGIVSVARSYDTGTGNNFVIEDYALLPGSSPEAPELTVDVPLGEEVIRLSWDGAIGAESYHIWRRVEGEDSFQLIEKHFSERSMQQGYADEAVEAGQKYTYRVEADNLFGTSSATEVSSAAQLLTNYALGHSVTSSRDDAPRPPSNVVDGDFDTFWVSEPGGATPETPAWLEIDLGQERIVSTLSIVPRPDRFGPKDIVWQVRDEVGDWIDVVSTVAAPVGRTAVQIAPLATRRVRLYMTSGHDTFGPGGSNRNVQVAEMEVWGPSLPGD